MVVSDLESRISKVLEATVSAYIDTATPVSSQLVSHRVRLGVSPATIRHIMHDLEDMGYIRQPHTSAGRIPTDKGYRYYVNVLMRHTSLQQTEAEWVDEQSRQWVHRIDQVLDQISKMLCQLTGCAATVALPVVTQSRFRRLEMAPLSDGRMVVVLLAQSGLVWDTVVDVGTVSTNELQRVANFLNAELAGVQLALLDDVLLRKRLEVRDSMYGLLQEATRVLKLLMERSSRRLLVEGLGLVLDQPEFRDSESTRRFVQLFDRRQELWDIMAEDLEAPGVQVHIGRENARESLRQCSMVSASYGVGNTRLGVLGVIGPTRMNYARATAVIEHVTAALDGFLERLGGAYGHE